MDFRSNRGAPARLLRKPAGSLIALATKARTGRRVGRKGTARSIRYLFNRVLSPFVHLRHFTFLIRPFAADRALPNLIFQHGIVSGASSSELLSGKDLADIDQGEREAENDENNG